MQADYDALIIGGGPAGSTAAILLAQAGWSVALIEKQRFPRRKVCGECVAASNLPLLDTLGIGDAFRSIAGPELRRMALMCGTQTVIAPLPMGDNLIHPWGRALGREHLDAMLLERAKTVQATVLQPWVVRSLSGKPGNFHCGVTHLDGGQAMTLHAPVAIAAHGSWEPLPAERMRRRAERRASDLLAFKANFSNVQLEHGLLPVLSFRGGYGGMVVADHGSATLACCIREDQLNACRAELPGEKAGAVVEAYLRRECTGVRLALDNASRVGPWLAAGRIRPGVRLPRRGAHVFLIGNAAGEAHPIVGEGISMAIQSAWLLCEQLLLSRNVIGRGVGVRKLQRDVQHRYAAQWRSQFRPRMRVAWLLAQTAMRPGVAGYMLPLLRRAPALLTDGARWSGKIRYVADSDAISRAQSQPRQVICTGRPQGLVREHDHDNA